MAYHLLHNNSDELRLFRRNSWEHKIHMDGIYFTWLKEKQAYVYVTKVRTETKSRVLIHYKYTEAYHDNNGAYGYSKVGKPVFESDDIRHIATLTNIEDPNNKIKEKETKEMKKDVNYIGGEYKAVSVRYIEDGSTGRTYTFKADLDIAAKMEEGTFVVVEGSTGYGLAKVVKVYDKSIKDKDSINKYNEATAWIVNIVDTKAQDARKDATERKAFILKELDERKAQVEEIAIYEYLAKNDNEAGKLLAELKQLTNPTLEVL